LQADGQIVWVSGSRSPEESSVRADLGNSRLRRFISRARGWNEETDGGESAVELGRLLAIAPGPQSPRAATHRGRRVGDEEVAAAATDATPEHAE
jgi:hypothetical protein